MLEKALAEKLIKSVNGKYVMQIAIREFRKDDAEDVCRLVAKTFGEFVAPEFGKHGIQKFLGENTPEKQVERSKTRDVYVALLGKRLAGMIEGNGHDKITRLFIGKKYHGKGIGKRLVMEIEKLYRKKGSKRIIVFSSIHAISFYKRLEYKKSTRLIKKEGFVYQPMKKKLKRG